MRLIYHPEAEAELIEAAKFYEQRVPNLGAQWLEAADLALSHITTTPEHWRIVELDVRRYLMPRFPYTIYYRLAGDTVHVLAFKHHKRHQDYWRHRMSE